MLLFFPFSPDHWVCIWRNSLKALVLHLSLNVGKFGGCIICLLCSLGSFMRVCFCYFYDIRLPEELWWAVTLRPLSINHIQLPSIVPGYQSLMTTPPDPCGPVGLTSRHKSNRVGLHTEPFWVAVTESHRLVDRKSHFFSRKASGLFFLCCQCVLGQRARGSGSEPAILHCTLAQETQSRIDRIESESNYGVIHLTTSCFQ